MHLLLQDAHEFLNYLLNECSELLEKEAKDKAQAASKQQQANGAPAPVTWIHELFQVTHICLVCIPAKTLKGFEFGPPPH